MRYVGEGVVLLLLVVIVVYVAVRLALKSQRAKRPDPMAQLRGDLATGRITEEEFWTRESALRASEPRRRRR